MSDVRVLTALVGPSLIAWLWLRRAIGARGAAAHVECAGIAVAVGVAFTSIGFVGWRLAGLSLAWYPAADLALEIIALALYWRVRQRSSPRTSGGNHSATTVRAGWLGVIVLACAVGSVSLARDSARLPHGEWDGWAIWNLRAAFLSVPNDHWRDGFTTELAWSHPDYPLLVPASVARLWSVHGEQASMVPRLFGIVLAAALAAVLAGSLGTLSGAAGAALALALLAVPHLTYWASAQSADVPLALFLLIAVTSLAAPASGARYWIAGLAAGCAAWTKNEGAVAAVILLALMPCMLPRGGARRLLAWRFAQGMAIGIAALMCFKVLLATPPDLLRGMLADQPLAKFLDAQRHWFVARHVTSDLLAWGGPLPVPAMLLVVAGLATGIAQRRVPRGAALGMAVTILLAGAYYLVYVLTPLDLEWHLRTSSQRLIAQLWPMIVWTTALLAAPPQAAHIEDPAVPSVSATPA